MDKKISSVTARREKLNDVTAETAFVTLGFRSNLDILSIEKAGLALNEYGHVKTNEFGQTEQEHIYVVGDAERTISAVYSMACARVAALHLLGKEPQPVQIEHLPLSFHDHPEAANVGYTKTDNTHVNHNVINYNSRNFGAFLNNQKEGFLKLVWDDQKYLIGASAVGFQAKDLISQLALMIKYKININELTTHFSAHPSISELAIHALHFISVVDKK